MNSLYGTFQNVVVTAQYSYGWSFFLAVLGFLGAEFSAVLCLTAFLNRLDSEVKQDLVLHRFRESRIQIETMLNADKICSLKLKKYDKVGQILIKCAKVRLSLDSEVKK